MLKQFEEYRDTSGEIGFVQELRHGIVTVSGLPGVRLFELVVFENGALGQAISLYPTKVDVLLFSAMMIAAGTQAVRTGERVSVPVGDDLLGKTLSPLGTVVGSLQSLRAAEYRHIDTRPAGIMARAAIDRPLETGVSIVDLIVPLGKGQRELIIGDRKSGKTSFILQAITTQSKQGVVCIYCAIGKRMVEIKQLEEHFKALGISQQVIIIAASSNEPTGMQFLAPYSALTIAEYFRDQGRDSLVVFDDLTAHANVYREISLLIRRFPGRSAYPGDIFYTHARLLERGGNFALADGKTASISCLPVAQSVMGDISAYITTNIMSMTDGHIFFDTQLFDQGRRPAVSPFLSVTRVGLQAQTPLVRDVSRQLSSFLVYYERIKQYTHFGAEVSQSVRDALGLGERVVTFFQQLPDQVVPLTMNIYILGLLWGGLWSDKNASKTRSVIDTLLKRYLDDQGFHSAVDALVLQSSTFQEVITKAKASIDTLGVRYDVNE